MKRHRNDRETHSSESEPVTEPAAERPPDSAQSVVASVAASDPIPKPKRDPKSKYPYIHPESLHAPAHLQADVDDVIQILDHQHQHPDKPDIEAEWPSP